MDKLIYLASPYTSAFQDIIERRVRQVQDATAKFIDQGHLIFAPIVYSHPIADQVSFSALNHDGDMSPWMRYDKAMIDRCAEVWVLCLTDWDKSLGVKAEIEYALEQGKRVRYFSYPDLREQGHIKNASTLFGAGKFYSPASNGKPPVKKFASETHTTYAQADGDGGYAAHQCDETCPSTATYHGSLNAISFRVELEDFDSEAFLEGLKPTTLGKVKARKVSMPDDAADRNSYPMAEGLLYYFPNALAEVSKISKFGNDQHNPGQAMHWSRGKSTDHANKIMRHLIDAGLTDEHGNRHSAFVAWRALALLQEELEQANDLPLPKNAWVDEQ